MCSGPSAAENNLANQQAAFSATLQQDYAQTFANNQQILSTLNGVLQPIVTAGPNQQGYSPAEQAALSTQAIDSNAQGYQQTMKALGAQENARGGGQSFLPSGVDSQINAGLANAAESNLSNEQLGITTANYDQGLQNWQNALSGEQQIAAGQNPTGYANAGIQSNQSAFNEASSVNQQSQQMWSDVLGIIPGIGRAIASPVAQALPTGPNASSAIEGILAGI